MKLWHVGPIEGGDYEGLTVHAVPGVHEAALEELEPPPSKVLDAACGAGALSLRLTNAGYDVVGVDIVDTARANVPGLEFLRLDLDNSSELDGAADRFEGAFDMVVSLETIEHLKAPWGFIAFCAKVLKPGGQLVVSTPNIASVASRMLFLQSGRFALFGEENVAAMGHISPISDWELRNIVTAHGLEWVGYNTVGPMPVFWFHGGAGRSLKWLFSVLVGFVIYPFIRGPKNDWVLMATAKKPIE